jgi:hypothetical protein
VSRSVYCAVRTGSLNTVHISDRVMVPTVCRRPLTVAAWIRFEASQYEMCGEQSDTGTDFPPSTSVFPCQYFPPMFVTYPLDVALTRTNGRSLGTLAKAISCPKSERICQRSADTYCVNRYWRFTHAPFPATLQITSTNKTVTSNLKVTCWQLLWIYLHCTAYERLAAGLWQWHHNRAIR